MRQIDHFIAGGSNGAGGSGSGGSSGSGRTHKVWNPSTGEVQAEVALGDAALLDRAIENAKKVQPQWAHDQSADAGRGSCSATRS